MRYLTLPENIKVNPQEEMMSPDVLEFVRLALHEINRNI